MTDNIHIHIDRIVLDDIDLSMQQRQQLKAIIVSELTHLWSTGNPPTTHSLPRMAIALSPNQSTDPQPLGQHIAQSIHHQLGNAQTGDF